jgi:hypothetical protein
VALRINGTRRSTHTGRRIAPDVSNVVQYIRYRRSTGRRCASDDRVGATDVSDFRVRWSAMPDSLHPGVRTRHPIRLPWAPFGPCSTALRQEPFDRRAGEPATGGSVRASLKGGAARESFGT